VTPGQGDRAANELRLAHQALRSARLLLGAGAREDAASRLYYAVFQGAGAALSVRGRYAKTHSGQITLFTEEHGHAPLLGQLLKLRAYADYTTEFKASTEALTELIEEAAAFVERCRALVAHALEVGPDEADPPPDY
jgi:uncharacterized protein (UPF0332 family)